MKIAVQRIVYFFTGTNWEDPDKTEKYINALQSGDKFPPILVDDNGDGTFTCYDGHHRLKAHKVLNIPYIDCRFE
ncbi:hypothetical protein PCC9214_05399 (plasmid) [Planktothrix tepida]|uniref:Uncharacterized protein n=1 Tax=Planktothrix tepida PCC 9214 TaxID=671072 RepID=A0A1J1LPQ7_9CYAN|nr:ParB N-terminal domain-containing protein [Planktothrix tepida]CAD5988515.1 hypothetical protein PCC9214_05399 [Planktothrix tepida]CUR33900.1 hypothetical protein PL921460009 [Planktothrix tepida PCC 9214]